MLLLPTPGCGTLPSTHALIHAGTSLLQFNARSESVAEKPAFRRLVPARRCLVRLLGWHEATAGACECRQMHGCATHSWLIAVQAACSGMISRVSHAPFRPPGLQVLVDAFYEWQKQKDGTKQASAGGERVEKCRNLVARCCRL